MNLEKAEKYCVERLPLGWKFAWHNRVRVYGTCDYAKKTIYLSRKLTAVREDAAVVNTILHEIAHALTPGCKHNAVWKAKFISLGGDGLVRSADKLTDEQNPPAWVMVFEGEIIKRWYRRPNKSTFDKLGRTFIKGRRDETIGRLEIIPYSA